MNQFLDFEFCQPGDFAVRFHNGTVYGGLPTLDDAVQLAAGSAPWGDVYFTDYVGNTQKIPLC